MFGKLIGSTLGLVTDSTKVAIAPVVVTVDLARAVTKPVADAAEEIAKTAGELTKDKL